MPRSSFGLGILEVSWALTLSFVTGMGTYLWLESPQFEPPTDTQLCHVQPVSVSDGATLGEVRLRQTGDREGWLSQANPY